MDLANAGACNHVADVVVANLASGHYRDPFAGLIDERGDIARSIERGRGASRGEHPRRAELDHLLQRLPQVRREVEGLVKGERKPRCRAEQPPHALDVNTSVGAKDAGHDSGDSERPGSIDVLDHCIDIVSSVDEVAAAGPNHHEHRMLRLRNDGGDQLRTRSSSTDAEIGAQLDPVDASALGGDRAFEGLDRGFNEH
jgi:hypothetical protein